METAISVNGIPIRLTNERWTHIISEHPELMVDADDILTAIRHPDKVVVGPQGEYLAVKSTSAGTWLIVVYRIMDNDGFVITAFITTRRALFERREQVWP